jgi:biopolymer transport protein ExbD
MSARHGKNTGVPEVVLPITPMLDMAFQLLVFFIFTYHPSALEGQMEMSLPGEQVAGGNGEKPADPSLQPPKDAALTVVVEARQIGYTLTLEEKDGLVRVPLATVQDLKAELRKVLTRQEMATPGIRVQGSARLKWRDLVEVMDACRSVGFSDVHCGKPPDWHAGAW